MAFLGVLEGGVGTLGSERDEVLAAGRSPGGQRGTLPGVPCAQGAPGRGQQGGERAALGAGGLGMEGLGTGAPGTEWPSLGREVSSRPRRTRAHLEQGWSW